MPEKKTLETMTETLRTQTAPPSFDAPLPSRSRRSPGLSKPGLALAIAGTFGVGALLLAPRPALARSWGSVQNATLGSPNKHVRVLDGPHLRIESWSNGGRAASLIFTDRGKIVGESRIGKERSYYFFDFVETRGSAALPPDARAFGTVRQRLDPRGPIIDHETMLRDLVRKGEATRMANPPGEGEWYEVRVRTGAKTGPRHYRYFVKVDGESRIVERRSPGSPVRTLYDYPAAIPASTFEPRPQSRPAPVIDVEATRKEIVRRMRRGYGERRGVGLRLALMDQRGKLFLFWTGPGIGEGTRGDVRLPSLRADRATGIAADLAQYRSPARRGVAVAINRTLAGRAIVPRQRIGDRVTVAIPGRGGEAVFRDVPVLRVDDLRYERDVLGYGVHVVYPKLKKATAKLR